MTQALNFTSEDNDPRFFFAMNLWMMVRRRRWSPEAIFKIFRVQSGGSGGEGEEPTWEKVPVNLKTGERSPFWFGERILPPCAQPVFLLSRSFWSARPAIPKTRPFLPPSDPTVRPTVPSNERAANDRSRNNEFCSCSIPQSIGTDSFRRETRDVRLSRSLKKLCFVFFPAFKPECSQRRREK